MLMSIWEGMDIQIPIIFMESDIISNYNGEAGLD